VRFLKRHPVINKEPRNGHRPRDLIGRE
jgi:hypothetical protein